MIRSFDTLFEIRSNPEIIFVHFSLDPDITVTYTFWSVVIGGWFGWLSIYGTNQAMVQRYISAKNESTAIWYVRF